MEFAFPIEFFSEQGPTTSSLSRAVHFYSLSDLQYHVSGYNFFIVR
jgi:hypothetical protein